MVQAYHPNFHQPTRMSDIWHHAHRHEQWKRAASLVAFVKDLKLALALKIRPDQSQAFEEVNNSQAFTVGKKKTHLFLNEQLAGAPRHVCTKFRANIRRADCVGPISSHI